MAGQLKVTLVRSLHGRLRKHQACVKGLGIHRIHRSSVVDDTPQNRGMINKARYMLKVEKIPDET